MNSSLIKISLRCIAILLSSMTLNQCTNRDEGEKSEVSIIFKGVESETLKPPMRAYIFDIRITNPGANDSWYLWSSGEAGIPEDGRFSADEEWDDASLSVEAIKCDKAEGKGTWVVFHFVGKSEDNSFYAMLIPSGGSVEISNFPLKSFGKRSAFEIIKCDSLLVNGTTSMSEWLPWDIHNSEQVKVSVPTGGFVDIATQASLPKVREQALDELRFITAKSVSSHSAEIPE